MNAFVVILVCLPAMALGMNCTGVADGNYEIGCRSYVTCTSGVPTSVNCDIGTAYNKDTGRCDDINVIPPPCGVMMDCTNKNDGGYADGGCASYYTCVGGVFVGHNFCPASLVFDEVQGVCDWPKNVPAPCGTFTP